LLAGGKPFDWLVKPRPPKMTWEQIERAIIRRKIAIRKWKQRKIEAWQSQTMRAGNCRQCGKPREINPKTGKLFYYCPPCHAQYVLKMSSYMRKRRAGGIAK
jgi:hypothetical protein